MISKTLTGILNDNRNQTYDIPCSISDIFYASSNINFCCPLSLISSNLSISLDTTNISNYSLLVRITTSLDSPANVINYKIINLNSSNLLNNFLVVNITELTNLFNHDYLIENMSQDEIFSLSKNYKIIFRLNLNENINNNLNQILNLDFTQDINFTFNTFESGPYDVSYKDLDIVSPFDFTLSERQSIFNNNPSILGGEKLRLFYPKNIQQNNKSPLFILFHGNNQFTENYDSYLSSAAGYGYVAFSCPVDQNITGSLNLSIQIIKLLNHLKTNISKINNGFLNNIINFSKINVGGHSRGGDLSDTIILALQNKGGTFSSIQTSNIDVSHIKSNFLFGAVNDAVIADNGLVCDGNTVFDNINSDTIKYFQRRHFIPTLNIRAKFDNQSGTEASQSLLMQYGVSYDTKRNTIDKGVVIFDNGEHSELADYYFKDFVTGGPNSDPSIFGRNEVNHTFNSTASARNQIKSFILEFLAINNFNSNKLKKLRYIDRRIQKKKINFNNLFPCRDFYFNTFNDIKYYIDEFKGITMSLAGTTGCTFTIGTGFTYDYGIDIEYFNGFIGNAYTIEQANDLNLYRYLFDSDDGVNYSDNDTFNGIGDFTYKALFLPIESNINFGYTFSNGLTFNENDYLCVRGALKTFVPYESGNTLNANFNLTLFDVNNNFSTLTSKNNSFGFEKVLKIDNISYASPGNNNNSIPTSIFFRVGDFNLKNSSLGITNINQILLQFGPDYGSTFAHLALDEFVVIKEL